MSERPIIMMGGSLEDWGIIPSFLDLDDPRPAREQFAAKYIAGWNPFKGFTFDKDEGVIHYKGDPPLKVVSAMLFREECILLFPYAWVLIMQTEDNSWEIARMD
jgi:hypothetical protein